MTDKGQIMIDVNKCKYRDSYTNFCLAEKDDIGETYTICTGTDCYFKQLARKAQELEKLREANDEKNKFLQDLGISAGGEFKRIKFYIESLKNKCDEKVKECEELKFRLEEYEKYGGIIDEGREWATLADCYRKALEEIEKVTKNLKQDICNNCGWRNTDGCTPSGMVCEELIKILDIINKAKGEANDLHT